MRSSSKSATVGLVCAVLLVALIGAVGCGGGGGAGEGGGGQETTPGAGATTAAGGETTAATEQGVVKTIQIEETEYELNPAKVTLDKPGTYVFVAKNTGQVAHALEIEGKGIEKETENIQPGQSGRLKVDLKRGTYDLYCPVDGHKQRGMDGQIKVAVKGGGGKGGDTGGSGGGY